MRGENYELYTYEVHIRKIIDGDSINVDIDLGFGIILRDQIIRIKGVDTPEVRTSDREEKAFGVAAKHYVQTHLPEGTTQIMKSTLDKSGDTVRGKFGRILADFIISDGKLLSDSLVDEHLAVPYEGGNKELLEAMHMANREILKSRGVVRI